MWLTQLAKSETATNASLPTIPLGRFVMNCRGGFSASRMTVRFSGFGCSFRFRFNTSGTRLSAVRALREGVAMQRSNFGDQVPMQPGAGGPPAFLPPGAYYPPQHGGAQQYAPNPFVVASPNMAPPTGHRMLPTILELVSSFKRRWVLCLQCVWRLR